MLDFNNPVAVLCFPSDTADGLGEVQVPMEDCHPFVSLYPIMLCGMCMQRCSFLFFNDQNFSAASIEPTCTAV